MDKVSDLLKSKGSQVWTVYEDKTVEQAIAVLVEHNIGSLIVLDDQHRIAGIITERDVLRKSYRHPNQFGEMKVSQAMTVKDDLIVGLPDDTLEYIMQVMTQNRIRHVPVVDGERMMGMVSIGDVVKARLDAIQAENHYLREFLGDKYPA
ncbi:MAG: CBS domain-containing protein [Candidatus Glassbacteria bacterium]|nr:CBS domain-containing protein [Candidatus Glassbacteria bacterium]